VENEVQGLVKLGCWKGRYGREERVGGRVKYLDVEEESDEGHESGGCCEADAGGGTGYGDVSLGRNLGGLTFSLRLFMVWFELLVHFC
jgi:hypothetical protein